MKKHIFGLGLFLLIAGCGTLPPVTSPTAPELTQGLATVNQKVQVDLETNKGLIVLEINGVDAPISAGNFLDLVKRNFYTGLTFHRVVKKPQPFVIQSGDPRNDGTGGFIDPLTGQERTIPLELKPKGAAQPLYGQVLDPVTGSPPPMLRHDKGVIAWARGADPNSASSQFYITLAPLGALDGQYAVFGKVIKGMDVVEKIEQGDKILKVTAAPNAP